MDNKFKNEQKIIVCSYLRKEMNLPMEIQDIILAYYKSIVGLIAVNGNGCLYATLIGNHWTVKHKISGVESWRKNSLERQKNYIRECAEMATHQFITGDRANVDRLVLAGHAYFKNELNRSDLFHLLLKTIVDVRQ